MKGLLFFCVIFFIAPRVNATLHVVMFPTPEVVVGASGVTNYYSVDVDNNGIDDCRIKIFSFGGYEISFESLNGQGIEAEELSSGEGIAYTCGASFGAGYAWSEETPLADWDDGRQFGGKGPRYLALRKQISGLPFESWIYGWAKIECAQDGSQFTLYGYAYNDVPDDYPTVVAGQGECILNAVNDLDLPANAISIRGNTLTLTYLTPLSLRVFDVSGKMLFRDNLFTSGKEYNLPQLSNIFLFEVSDGIKSKVIKYAKAL